MDQHVDALLDEARRLVRSLPISALQATSMGMIAMMQGDGDGARYRFGLSRELCRQVSEVERVIKQLEEW